MRNKEKVHYLCDGKGRCCSNKNCYLNGGGCKHTKDISHAKNFENFREGSKHLKPIYKEKESKERTVELRFDMKAIKEAKLEMEQLIELLREANDKAAPLNRC